MFFVFLFCIDFKIMCFGVMYHVPGFGGSSGHVFSILSL